MESPVFEQFDPGSDCDCPGCVHWRRVLPHSPAGRTTAHPAARPQASGPARAAGTPMVLALAAVASAALGASHTAPAAAAPHPSHRVGVPARDEPDTPQGDTAPLHGPDGPEAGSSAAPKLPAITRSEIIKRARTWVSAKVPYSMNAYWSDGYRQDCSGYVSMAWKLPGNEWTGSLARYGERISKDELQPGDILLFHNPAAPTSGSHVVIFGGWKNSARTSYTAYEQIHPHTRRRSMRYPYKSDARRYVPYRYKGVTAPEPNPGPEPIAGVEPNPGAERETPGTATSTPYPGAAYFGPGADNEYVELLGRMLVARGAGAVFASDPGPRWTDATREATRAFQLAQGWEGAEADGLPGPRTWELLVTGKGEDVRPGAAGSVPSSHGVPGYPGRAWFRPGAVNEYISQLGTELVRRGFGRFYPAGPGPQWGEGDRRAVEAFQRSQGWRGGAANGYPGPETWRRLFS
ncbi:peptidoglycan-binding protein [Streptomyces djakartensis]|uniref:Membrane protein n=1 Tax=Streptomyces djakartensis TaxID=68193 RepID=A0ABQ2ZIC9_9ACTN|nr:peptidoglycan-binding protein [Streptomyces djakartensis]GGY17302.1 membrane protein [Streptomyces djakartensis]